MGEGEGERAQETERIVHVHMYCITPIYSVHIFCIFVQYFS